MSRENEIELLSELAFGSLERLAPSTDGDSEIVTYPDAAESLNNDRKGTLAVLESLRDRGLLLVEFYEKVHACTTCNEKLEVVSMVCSACESPQTVRETVLEHLACGCVQPRSAFETESEEYRCPDCRKTVRALGVDYAKVGQIHTCENCGEQFDTPAYRHVCESCGTALPLSETDECNLHSYRFNEEKTSWLEVQLHLRQHITPHFEKRGFTVETGARITGASGIEYDADLYACDDALEVAIVVSVHHRPTPTDIARLSLVADDVGGQPVLFSIAPPEAALDDLTDRLGVTLVDQIEHLEETDFHTTDGVVRNLTSAD